MPYWQLVTRSFRIAWDHKYLWLIALFSGEGASSGLNYSSYQRQTGTTQRADFTAVQHQVASWVSSHIALLLSLFVLWLIVVIAFFILAAVCEGATVRGSAEHDAERPFGLRAAWRTGVHLMWVIVRFRLLLLALTIPLILLIAGWAIGLVAALANSNAAALVSLVFTGLLLLVVWLVYGTYLFFLDRLGTRAIVLEELMAIPGIARAHRLLFKRLGRTLLVWLLSIGVALVVGIALACVFAIVLLPIFVIGAAVASASSTPLWPFIVLGLLIGIPVSLVVGGFLSAQGSTYWTLAFRRLDLDYAPAQAYPAVPQTPPSPQA